MVVGFLRVVCVSFGVYGYLTFKVWVLVSCGLFGILVDLSCLSLFVFGLVWVFRLCLGLAVGWVGDDLAVAYLMVDAVGLNL